MRSTGKVLLALGVLFAGVSALAAMKKGDSVYSNDPNQKNPMEGKRVRFVPDASAPENADGTRGRLEAVGPAELSDGFYERVWKRALDVGLSFCGLVALSPVLLGLAIAIYLDDPGPILFTQKRIGRNKQYFKLHKFRSMRMDTPHDVPTHMLTNPEQYITRVGKFIRAHSLDELPQIWDIFLGNMSVIGPRPALWNQDVLTAQRDRCGANDVRPGLTGWAQINGRDELELPDKARLDGEYAQTLKAGGWKAFLFDCRCFVGTVFSVLRKDGVVEGGTGELHREGKTSAAKDGHE